MASAKWYDDLVDTKLQIAQRTPSPKLLIVGGSSTHFGIRAEEIQRELGKPTVNFGLFADISLPVMLDLVSSVARPGDVILLALEYQVYAYDAMRPPKSFISYVLNGNRDVLSHLPYADRAAVIFSIPPSRLGKGFQAKLRNNDLNLNNSDYDAATVNRFGDETAYPESARSRRQLRWATDSGLDEHLLRGIPNGGWKLLEKFLAKCRRSGIHVIATFPAIMNQPGYKSALIAPDQITAFFSANNVTVLGTARDALYEPALFYDHQYHMNEKGRELRTSKLIDLLRLQE